MPKFVPYKPVNPNNIIPQNIMLLEKYNPNWVNDFNSLKTIIAKALHGLNYEIEHVGSTAVPNLDAKPIIDMDIIYQQPADFATIKERLENIGYYHNGNQGIEDRDVFKRTSKSSHEILDSITHHLYVCRINSQALERHILSRDFLRKNEWAIITYQEMKYQLAEMAGQDRKKYAELKELHVNAFIDEIIAKEKNERPNEL